MERLTQYLPKGRIWSFVGLVLALLLFFTSLELLQEGFQLMGEGAAETLLATTRNPITGFFVGILATSLLQSSSTTTTLTVGLVAAGTINAAAAIPVMLGANIGTSVTNTIVSLGHVNNREEFQRAFTGSLVLDYFNIVAAVIFLILEIFFNVLSWPATQLTNVLTGIGAINLFDPIDIIVEPIAEFIIGVTQETGWIVLILAIALLYVSIRSLVKALTGVLDQDLEQKVKKYLFGSPWVAMLFGLAITIAVQSSSITTSVIVPLLALGILVAMQALPYFLGANIGTSTTALIAALALATDGDAEGTASLMVALVHMVFDIFAIILLFTIPKIRAFPVKLAERTVGWFTKGRVAAIAYIGIVFYLLPLGVIWFTRDLDMLAFYEPTVPQQVKALKEGQTSQTNGTEQTHNRKGQSNGENNNQQN